MKFLVPLFLVVAVTCADPIGVHLENNNIKHLIHEGLAVGLKTGNSDISQLWRPGHTYSNEIEDHLRRGRKIDGITTNGNTLLQDSYKAGVLTGIELAKNQVTQTLYHEYKKETGESLGRRGRSGDFGDDYTSGSGEKGWHHPEVSLTGLGAHRNKIRQYNDVSSVGGQFNENKVNQKQMHHYKSGSNEE